jgi:hypothetical protein
MDRGGPSITRRGRGRAVVLAAVLAAVLGATASPALAADGQWGFEQVTPVEKGAGTVAGSDTFTAAPDGNSIIHTATGSYEGVPSESVPAYVRYLGARGPDSWVNHPLDPTYDIGTGSGALANIMATLAASPDMSHVLVTSKDALTPGATQGGSNHYIRNGRTGALTLIATTTDQLMTVAGHTLMGQMYAKFVANDGRAALFVSPVPLTPDAAGVPTSPSTIFLYAWHAGSGLTLESILPASEGGGVVDKPLYVTYDDEDGEVDSAFYGDALSRVYFATDTGVYLRSGGVTRAISVSRIAGDPDTPVGGWVNGVVGDGRYVVFQTRGARLTDDTPNTSDNFLYRYDAVTDSLTYVGSIGTWDERWSVMQVSSDGQTIAFRSPVKLDPAATEFATNIYVWRNGTLRFVATADPGSSLASGVSFYLRYLSDDGRYLSFSDNSTSRAASFGVDNVSSGCPRPFIGGAGPCTEVYVYDDDEPDAAKRLSCASCRTDGLPPVSDAGDPGLLISDRPQGTPGRHRFVGHQSRMVADDGTVFFTTYDGLVAEDGNGLKDVYAYRDGAVRLVSRALPGHSSRFLEASVDGKAIFFSTSDPISPTDVDKSVDVYVTRVGAGYPYTAPVRVPACAGNDCRGPVAPLGPLVLPSTDAVLGSGNVAVKPRVPAPGSPVVKAKTSIRGSAGSLRVSVRVVVRLVPREGASRSVRAGLTFKSISSKGR